MEVEKPRLSVLGPLRVHGPGGEPVAIASATQRRLLALLAIEADTIISSDRLAELLDVSAGALRTSISRLRRVVGEDIIVTEPPGYVLRSTDVDALRFDHLLDEARRAAAEPRLELLERALSLWSGGPYAEFSTEPWAIPTVSRLEERRALAEELRAESLIESDRRGEAIADLERQVEERPHRDRVQGLLMSALAAEGRRVEALQSFHLYRKRLVEQTGTEPSAALRSIERRIATEDLAAFRVGTEPRPTRLLTIVFTDIEGSTRLWAQHPSEMQRNLERHDMIVLAAAGDTGGQIFSTAGDSFGVAFDVPNDAISFASRLQQVLASEPWLEPAAIRVRVGIHLGVVSERGGDYFGHTLNVTARVEEAAHGAQVVLTNAVVPHLDADIELTDLGVRRLRDIPETVHLFQLNVEGLAVEYPPPRVVSRAISNLPAQRGALVGRDDDILVVRDLLLHHRMVALVGPGGVGKTRLAIQAAGEESLGGDVAVAFVDLATVSTELGDAVLAAAGISTASAGDPVELLSQLLLGQPMLLVLDNCESMVDEAAALADGLLDRLPELSVLATSQVPIGIREERVWRVPSLPVGPGGAAVQLFELRATDVDGSFVVDGDNRAAVAELCRDLDGLPLAIELAASRVLTSSVSEIRQGLDDRFRLLRSLTRGRTPRQQTMEAVVQWSYDLCTADEQRMLEEFVVFPGTFDRADAAGIAGVEAGRANDLFDSLVNKSLIQAGRLASGRLRYRLLASIRAFGRSRLVDRGGLEDARDRHLNHFLETDGAPPDLRLAEITRRIELRDFDNIRAAADWALERGDQKAATGLTVGRTMAIVEHGAVDRAIPWLAGRDRLSTNDHLWALNGCAYAAVAQGDHAAAEAFIAESAALADGHAFDAIPNTHCFHALNVVVVDPLAALSAVDLALEIAPATPSGDAHLPIIHFVRSLVRLHLRDWAGAIDDADTASVVAGRDSPYFSVANSSRLAVAVARGDFAAFATDLAAIDRPARWGAHEWTYQLFDLVRPERSGADEVGALARTALSAQGGEPLQQARDLLAVLSTTALRVGDLQRAEELAVGGVSGSIAGALAFQTLAAIKNWDDDAWLAEHQIRGSESRTTSSRDRALTMVRGLAQAKSR